MNEKYKEVASNYCFLYYLYFTEYFAKRQAGLSWLLWEKFS